VDAPADGDGEGGGGGAVIDKGARFTTGAGIVTLGGAGDTEPASVRVPNSTWAAVRTPSLP
jgi:hypothetical protein